MKATRDGYRQFQVPDWASDRNIRKLILTDDNQPFNKWKPWAIEEYLTKIAIFIYHRSQATIWIVLIAVAALIVGVAWCGAYVRGERRPPDDNNGSIARGIAWFVFFGLFAVCADWYGESATKAKAANEAFGSFLNLYWDKELEVMKPIPKNQYDAAIGYLQRDSRTALGFLALASLPFHITLSWVLALLIRDLPVTAYFLFVPHRAKGEIDKITRQSASRPIDGKALAGALRSENRQRSKPSAQAATRKVKDMTKKVEVETAHLKREIAEKRHGDAELARAQTELAKKTRELAELRAEVDQLEQKQRRR